MRGFRDSVRDFLATLLRLLPTPKSKAGFLGYVLFVLSPVLVVLTLWGHADLIANNIERIESALLTWWVYPLLMVFGFLLLLYAGYNQPSRQQPRIENAAPTGIDSRQAQDDEPTAAYANMAIAQLAEDKFEGFKRNVFALGLEALSARSFQIERASIDKSRLVIVVEDAKGRLHLGDKLRVVDAEDFYPMGTFEVVRKRAEDCYAVGGKDVDGVWLTAVRNHREGDPVTYKIAILAERRAEQ